MSNKRHIQDIIEKVIFEVLDRTDIDEEVDLFSLGISSLSVVNIQMIVEERLGYTIETTDLMKTPDIKSWVTLYEAASEQVA